MADQKCDHCGNEIVGRIFQWKGFRVCITCRADLERADKVARPGVPSRIVTEVPPSMPADPDVLPKNSENTPESCDNCGRIIGKLETPQIWNDHVVCLECHGRLSVQPRVEKREHIPREPEVIDSFVDPEINARAGRVMLRVFFWIIAGLVILFLLDQISGTGAIIHKLSRFGGG